MMASTKRCTRLAALALGLLVVCPIFAKAQAPSTPNASPATPASATPEQAALLKKTETFLRNLFGWGSDFKVDLGPLTDSASADFYTVPIHITINGQSDNGTVFVSKDGKTFVRGEMFSMTKDPFEDTRAKIHVEDSPSKGPADAKVTIVEFSDFECPHCRVLYSNLKELEAEFPQVRVVFKSFPLAQIHPWAETAAIGARCAYNQKPTAFWPVHDLIFDNQDILSAENIWDKLVSYAAQSGLDADVFKQCLASQEAKQSVAADHAQGEILNITSTPTVFVNGRTVVGGDKPTLEQLIRFEQQAHPER